MNKDQESQSIEFKENWKDEYLKWICGFANAQGGKLVIGKNDKGEVVGVDNASKLLEDIPNKVKDILGIIVDVNLKNENGLNYIEVDTVQHPYPVNYKGEYHYRSGNTKQELKGAALNRFLLQKQGMHWDSVSLPKVKLKDLTDNAFKYFKEIAAKNGRVDENILKDKNSILLDNLKLLEDNQLKRAAILMFHDDPEKYVLGAYIKIGFFRTNSDLLYQDEIKGNILEQADKTIDILLTKYLRAYISYQGIQRIETYPFPKEALREVILNAIVHKDYSSGNPIQISVYEDKIYIWNQGLLPQNWTVKNLMAKHPSVPFNPLIANAFFRLGFIEVWGRGFEKITEECQKVGNPLPILTYDTNGLMVEFRTSTVVPVETSVETSVENVSKASQKVIKEIAKNPQITIREIADNLNKTTRAIELLVANLVKNKQIEHVGPKKGGYWVIKQ